MARAQTEITELSAALGLLGYNTLRSIRQLANNPQKVTEVFQNTISPARMSDLLSVLEKPRHKIRSHAVNLIKLGSKLRQSKRFPCIYESNHLRLTGGKQQTQTTSMPKDILVGIIPISVKANSNVVANPSPENLFRKLPAGEVETSRSKEDWFLVVAQEEYERLYKAARTIAAEHSSLYEDLPDDLIAFLKWKRKERKSIGEILNLNKLPEELKKVWAEAYLPFVKKVSEESAKEFMHRYESSKKSPVVREMVLRKFLRLDACPYLLLGVDNKEGAFIFEVPDLTSWSQRYKLVEVKASAAKRQQPAVQFILVIEARRTGEKISLSFHSEVRWSHGKFVANPEAKLYKDIKWEEIPGYTKIIGWSNEEAKRIAESFA